jgi:endonuclease/exonuclease/phosphatase family metal-dependent hydrolase
MEETMVKHLVAAIVSCLFSASPLLAADLRIATFNTESDPHFTTDPVNIARTISEMGKFDILALQEVEDADAVKEYAEAAAHTLKGTWRSIISESGVNFDRKSDHVAIIYRSDMFREIDTRELHMIRSNAGTGPYGKPDWGLRAALAVRFQHKGGTEIQVVTVHLKCCGGNGVDIRTHQTSVLAKEIDTERFPTIVLGDTNIPIKPGEPAPDADGLPAFTNLTTGMKLKWVVPANPVATQCSPQFDSMLDQVFGPTTAAATAEIKFPDRAYCDREDAGYADHRPIVAIFPGLLAETVISATMTTADDTSTTDPSSDVEAMIEARESALQQMLRPGDVNAE